MIAYHACDSLNIKMILNYEPVCCAILLWRSLAAFDTLPSDIASHGYTKIWKTLEELIFILMHIGQEKIVVLKHKPLHHSEHQNITIFINKNNFKMLVCNLAVILFRPQCVDKDLVLLTSS